MTICRAALVLATLAAGCSSPAAAVRPARVASNAAADALAVVMRLEIARIKQVAVKNELSCPASDVMCLTGAIDAAFSTEKPRIDAIRAAIAAQNAVAEAVVQFDACSQSGGNVQACEADAIARVLPLAPELARLLEQAKGATK